MKSRRSSSSGQPSFLLLGRVLRPHGVRGELRIEVMTAYPERIVPESTVFIGPDPTDASSAVAYDVTSARKHQKYLILGLADVASRETADNLREQYVMVALADAVPLDDDEFYLYQAIGLRVVSEDGDLLGEVVEVIETGANDVYVVRGESGEILLPAIDECVIDVAGLPKRSLRAVPCRILRGCCHGTGDMSGDERAQILGRFLGCQRHWAGAISRLAAALW